MSVVLWVILFRLANYKSKCFGDTFYNVLVNTKLVSYVLSIIKNWVQLTHF